MSEKIGGDWVQGFKNNQGSYVSSEMSNLGTGFVGGGLGVGVSTSLIKGKDLRGWLNSFE